MVAAAASPAEAGGGVVRAFSEEAARPLVKTIVKRQFPLFSSFRDLTKNDLEQEGMRIAVEIHPKYDPARGAYSTFLYTRLPNRLTDLLRSRTATLRREKGTAEARGRPVIPAHPNERAGPDDLADDAPLHEWLSRLYRVVIHMTEAAGGKPHGPVDAEHPDAKFWARYDALAARVQSRQVSVANLTPKERRLLERGGVKSRQPRTRGRPPTFTPAQRMAMTALMRRLKLSTRGVVMLLAEREDLRRAIQLRRIPGQSWVVKSGKKLIPNSPLSRICFD